MKQSRGLSEISISDIECIADALNMEPYMVYKVYKTFWKAVRDNINSLNLKDKDYTEEEFGSLKTNFNIPSLGKLYCTYQRYNKFKHKYKTITNKHIDEKVNKNTTTIQ